jgi:hypothetical protein
LRSTQKAARFVVPILAGGGVSMLRAYKWWAGVAAGAFLVSLVQAEARPVAEGAAAFGSRTMLDKAIGH